MKFHFIDQAKTEFPVYRLCKVLGVIPIVAKAHCANSDSRDAV
jgi:hypothetical protein